ncbi:Fc.00g040360.m01.CDS01 [Cosmosporella sp. VM-42]
MPYNTRRKSISLPGLGIHIPMTHAARAAAAAAAAAASSSSSKKDARSSSSSASSMSPPTSRPESLDSHPSKRQKRSHGVDSSHVEQTPPPSPTLESRSIDMADAEHPPKIDLEGINDDIVEAVIIQLQSTANRPHLVKELATVLSQRLTVVQHSANPCAIISSRLAAYLKRSCWSALAACPLAKELETVHPRRTYFFLTTYPRQPLPEPNATLPSRRSVVTPSVSLTDDSTSDDADARRRELSPSPEVDLSPEFEDGDDDVAMPSTPIGSLPNYQLHRIPHRRDQRHNSPPLEKDEREFTQTADGLQKRKLNEELPVSDAADRNSTMEYGYRDDMWFGDHRIFGSTITSPSIKPSLMTNIMSSAKKDDEAENWLKLSKLLEWDKTAESIEIDELDCLLDSC